ncbi:MAG: AAA family ATPase [Nitrospirales bacterium]
MIRLESLKINEFRGIRNLTLDFKGNSFGICGPNGTGKSGVIDALEFGLTGNVSRLSGEGSGEVSLKLHGPHVDMRDAPEKASVLLKISLPSLKKSATIERNLKKPSNPKVTPNDPEILKVLHEVELHPEIVLSRRELIRYVLATPGNRAREVEALLQLNQVEKVRTALQRTANNCEKQLPLFTQKVNQSRDNLLGALDITELTQEKILLSVNAQRKVLHLPALPELNDITNFKDGMATLGAKPSQTVPKAQALLDILATHKAIDEITGEQTANCIDELVGDLQPLAKDQKAIESLQRASFYQTGMDLTTDALCPFCDTPWDLDELKLHIQGKINHLEKIFHQIAAAQNKAEPLTTTIQKVKARMESLIKYFELAKPPIACKEIKSYLQTCQNWIDKLTDGFAILKTIAALKDISIMPQPVLAEVAKLEDLVNDLPEPTKEDAARDRLTLGQERYEVLRKVEREEKVAAAQAKKARKIYDIYTATSDNVLTEIYKAVEHEFASFYGFVNRDDEDKFKAQIIPSMGKLGFNVDFYGRGFFPPGAYHSEGHQDGMGLCLYLALMKHLHGDGFTFAVLDDVLMSVDAGHRREVCTLLKNSFPNTQFILTTHDPIWLRHMRTEGLTTGRSVVQFRRWSVDHGPTQWDDRDVWEEIDDFLKINDVRAASALLRHYLEYTSWELCHRLRAPVEFRGDAQYQLGELLPAAIKQMQRLYAKAKEAANSYNQKEILVQITTQESRFSKAVEISKVEQWQVNAAIHFNSWDNLGKGDFEPVPKAFQELLRTFTCADPECGEYFRVSPDREAADCFRCDCGKINVNLRKKSA